MEFQLSYFKSWKIGCECAALNMQPIWKTQQWPKAWERSAFIPIPKKSNAKEWSNYCTIALMSQARISGMGEPGWLLSMGSHRVGHDWSDLAAEAAVAPPASKVMFKILQARLQPYMNCELPDVQAGFRKGRGTRDQIANIRWIIQKARVPERHLFLLYWLCQSLWLCGSQWTVENYERDGNTRPPDLPLEKPICRSGSNS